LCRNGKQSWNAKKPNETGGGPRRQPESESLHLARRFALHQSREILLNCITDIDTAKHPT
jgi:hypothetical protein